MRRLWMRTIQCKIGTRGFGSGVECGLHRLLKVKEAVFQAKSPKSIPQGLYRLRKNPQF